MSGPKRRSGDDAAPRAPGSRAPGSRAPIDRPDDPSGKSRGMERLSDLLPAAARQLGLDDQLEQARAAAVWLEIVAERIPEAAEACRLIDLRGGIATIETDEPIVAQEIRLRSLELLAALRAAARLPLRQIRVTTRHV